jgi:ubiquinone/menaquinone biosynthesis C-methylase UbiE
VKEPGAKVFEIGGGTGGATTGILQAFAARADDGPGSLLGHYDFTDISSGFFQAAKEKFAAWEGMISYTKLDIETDPVQQGFTTGSYDLLTAAQVLHATRNLKRTLTNVRAA